MKNIKEMNISELRAHLSNLEDCERRITNNYNWWVHPDTNRQAQVEFAYNRAEMKTVHDRLKELED